MQHFKTGVAPKLANTAVFWSFLLAFLFLPVALLLTCMNFAWGVWPSIVNISDDQEMNWRVILVRVIHSLSNFGGSHENAALGHTSQRYKAAVLPSPLKITSPVLLIYT